MKLPLLTLLFFVFISSVFARSAYKVEGNSVIVNLEGIGAKSKLLKVELWSTNTLRVVTTMNDQFSNNKCILGDSNTADIKFKVAYSQTSIEITTSALLINIEENGLLRLQSRNGRKLMVESDRSFEPSSVIANTYKVSESFYLTRQEHLYGSEQNDQTNRFNLRNQNFNLVQDNTSIASSVFFSEKGYAFIWENGSNTNFTDTPSGLKLTSEIADEISYIFINGPEWATLINEIRTLTGQVPLLPKWAYGYHLNPLAFNNSEEIASTLEKYQVASIPVEVKQTNNQLYLEEKLLTANPEIGRYTNAWAYQNLKDKFIQTQKETTTERLVLPTHINCPGIQKYGTFTVSGDITSSWKTLKSQVSAAITSSLTGQPYWSTTLGGIKQSDDFATESFKELLVRWYQFAAFTPVFQGPALNKYDLFNATVQNGNAYHAISKAIQLRYQLLPYIYTIASTVSFENKTMLRSLLFEFPDDEKAQNIDQQYLLGRWIMVCPVTAKGATKQQVYFPAELNWYDFWTGKLIEGGKTIEQAVTLDQTPVYIKQGAIIPMDFQEIDSTGLSSLEIRIYGGNDGQFTLYEDENDGLGYKNGQFSKIEIEYSDKSKTVTINSVEGEYEGMPTERIFKVVLVSEDDGIGNKPSISSKIEFYKGKKIKFKLE